MAKQQPTELRYLGPLPNNPFTVRHGWLGDIAVDAVLATVRAEHPSLNVSDLLMLRELLQMDRPLTIATITPQNARKLVKIRFGIIWTKRRDVAQAAFADGSDSSVRQVSRCTTKLVVAGLLSHVDRGVPLDAYSYAIRWDALAGLAPIELIPAHGPEAALLPKPPIKADQPPREPKPPAAPKKTQKPDVAEGRAAIAVYDDLHELLTKAGAVFVENPPRDIATLKRYVVSLGGNRFRALHPEDGFTAAERHDLIADYGRQQLLAAFALLRTPTWSRIARDGLDACLYRPNVERLLKASASAHHASASAPPAAPSEEDAWILPSLI